MQLKTMLKTFARAVLVASITASVVAAAPANARMQAPLLVNPDDLIRRETPPTKQCETLLPMLQPLYWGTSATISATYWVFSVNFQEQILGPEGPGVSGCLTTIGRNPLFTDAPFYVLREDPVPCYFSTKHIAGSYWTTEDFGGKGLVSFGPPTLNASQYGGTGTGLWTPVTFSGGAYVRCPNVDLWGMIDYNKPVLPSSQTFATLDRVSDLKNFSMAVFGTLSVTTGTRGLITYVPDTSAGNCVGGLAGGCGPTSFTAQFICAHEPAGHNIRIGSGFNGKAAVATSASVRAGQQLYLHTELNSVNGAANFKADVAQSYFATTPAISLLAKLPTTVTTPRIHSFPFWTGKSNLYIGRGVSANAPAVEGTLYEAVIDPSGDSKPPQ
jgi:hypothetical protein